VPTLAMARGLSRELAQQKNARDLESKYRAEIARLQQEGKLVQQELLRDFEAKCSAKVERSITSQDSGSPRSSLWPGLAPKCQVAAAAACTNEPMNRN